METIPRPMPPFLFPLFVMVLLTLATVTLFFFSHHPTVGYTIFFAEEEAIEILSPLDGLNVQPEEALVFKTKKTAPAGTTFAVRLYIHKDSPPEIGDLVAEKMVRASQFFTYTYIPTPSWKSGTYYWKVVYENVNTRGESVSSVNQFNVVSLSDIQAAQGANTNFSTDACEGGPGGHQSDSTGEKTFQGFTLLPGKTSFLVFNKSGIHGIEKMVLSAQSALPPNGLIIHQEFEKETEYTLPKIDAVYKTIHIHETHPWDEGAFYATIYFRVPINWIQEKERKRDEVHIQLYENGKWSPNPTFFEREEEGYYIYQSTLHGFLPFAIGACHKTRQGRLIPTRS